MAGPKKMPISEKFGAEVAEMALDYIKHRQGGVDHRPAKDRPDSVQLFREAAVLMRREEAAMLMSCTGIVSETKYYVHLALLLLKEKEMCFYINKVF
ncbi:hypothetical protein EB796_003219 [Bugula neritina]|uniref:Uncharacterized protein n=1 Tax=Bugula neritina TaxID=10212 RepID=A0A7J7KJQ5_BUGNE|nr:hypothetical protein EB796_003219 [Bugula neritina]